MQFDDGGTEGGPIPDEALVLAAVRGLHPLTAPSPEVAERHLRRMFAASDAAASIDLRDPTRTRRIASVALIAGATLTGSMGLAAAGVLPAPVQNGFANVVRPVGLHLPTHEDGVPAPLPPPEGTPPEPVHTAAPAAAAPASTVVVRPAHDGSVPPVAAPGRTPPSAPGGPLSSAEPRPATTRPSPADTVTRPTNVPSSTTPPVTKPVPPTTPRTATTPTTPTKPSSPPRGGGNS